MSSAPEQVGSKRPGPVVNRTIFTGLSDSMVSGIVSYMVQPQAVSNVGITTVGVLQVGLHAEQEALPRARLLLGGHRVVVQGAVLVGHRVPNT
jgi:hypothetical protein